MRVALDTNSLYVTRAGTSRYVRGLLQGLRQLQDPSLSVVEFAWPVENFEYAQPQRALKTAYRELVWARFVAPRILAREQVDLLHRGTPAVPIQKPRGLPEIVTLPDLALLRHPERYRRWQRRSARPRLERVKRAERIICISQFTANEAMELLGLTAQRLEVVYLGNDFDPRGPLPNESSPERKLPERFFLFVGSLEPGKNLALLKEVYRLAETRGLHLPPLAVIGARWVGVESEGAPPANWHYLGHQSDSVLLWLYRRAIALVFPSKYEGFGFPPLEAMSQGCPVICSRMASLPEVGGDAACYAESNPAAYLDAMLRMERDAGWREELIAKGLLQSANFSWRKCAEETFALYRKTLAS
ncbi:MAG: glycosyltransferase family 4 protein [Verrucomicrobiota bacterium]|nr:glycosyltransferase family 4 protein [Verrucomicrobiota bacterium]